MDTRTGILSKSKVGAGGEKHCAADDNNNHKSFFIYILTYAARGSRAASEPLLQ